MSQLKNPGWEASAQGYARGLSQQEACIAAGYSPKSNSAPGRIFSDEGVKARVAELAKQHDSLRAANLEETILAMLDLAATCDRTTAAGAKEARAARLEAHRLSGVLATRREAQAWEPMPREMTEAEWDAKYGPDAPGSGR